MKLLGCYIFASGSYANSVSQLGMRESRQSNSPRRLCFLCVNYHSRLCLKAIGAWMWQPGHIRKDCPHSMGAFGSSSVCPIAPPLSYSTLSPGNSSRPIGRGLGRGTSGRGAGDRGSRRGQPRVFALSK